MFNLSPQSTKPASQMTLSQTLPTIELAAPVADICDAVPESINSEAACPEAVGSEQLDTSIFEPEAIAQMADFQAEIPAKSDMATLERELSSSASQDTDDNQETTTNQPPQVSAEAGCDELLGTPETSMLVGTW